MYQICGYTDSPAVLYWYWHTTHYKQTINSCHFEVARWLSPKAILKCLCSLQLSNRCVLPHPDLWKHLFQCQEFISQRLQIILGCCITATCLPFVHSFRHDFFNDMTTCVGLEARWLVTSAMPQRAGRPALPGEHCLGFFFQNSFNSFYKEIRFWSYDTTIFHIFHSESFEWFWMVRKEMVFDWTAFLIFRSCCVSSLCLTLRLFVRRFLSRKSYKDVGRPRYDYPHWGFLLCSESPGRLTTSSWHGHQDGQHRDAWYIQFRSQGAMGWGSSWIMDAVLESSWIDFGSRTISETHGDFVPRETLAVAGTFEAMARPRLPSAVGCSGWDVLQRLCLWEPWKCQENMTMKIAWKHHEVCAKAERGKRIKTSKTHVHVMVQMWAVPFDLSQALHRHAVLSLQLTRVDQGCRVSQGQKDVTRCQQPAKDKTPKISCCGVAFEDCEVGISRDLGWRKVVFDDFGIWNQ